MARKKKVVVPTFTFGESSIPVEMAVQGSVQTLPALESALEAAARWLQSAPLDSEQRQSIAQATTDASSKMAVFQHVLGARRASRLARSQDWLDDIQERLMNEEMLAKKADDPYWLLNIGKFLKDIQQDDTAFITDLAKKAEEQDLMNARATLDKQDIKEKEAETSKLLAAIPPHKREKLRRLVEALTARDSK